MLTKWKQRTEAGFTLIELMVVVAIIGILAAIAIPNYLHFQCRAKQSEAKSNLGGIWTAEQAYFAKNGFYTSDMESLGWEPTGSPAYVYTLDIQAAYPASATAPNNFYTAQVDNGNFPTGFNDTLPATVAGLTGGEFQPSFQTRNEVDPLGNSITASEIPALNSQGYAAATTFNAVAVGFPATVLAVGGVAGVGPYQPDVQWIDQTSAPCSTAT